MTVINAVIGRMNETILALSPVERWAAARQGDANSVSVHWIVIFAVVILVVLAAVLIWVSYGKAIQRRQSSDKTFSDTAGRRGLSPREQKILMAVAHRSGLPHSDDIFTSEEAFARGAAKLLEQSRLQRGAEATQQLVVELTSLREKLGFKPRPQAKVATTKRGVSSRQIPEGKKLHLNRRARRAGDTIEGTIVGNDAIELTVRLAKPVRVTFGEIWRVRYYFGASLWEFDTAVMSCDQDILVFRHSESVRFVNRRRFVRVPVRNLAYISPFPFSRTLAGGEGVSADVARGVSAASAENWKPLEFVPALVTELAGPGLRLEAPLEVKVGERVLVVFKLDEHRDRRAQGTDGVAAMIIEDIGEVRRAQPVQDGFSIAVELVGLDDSDISELIRAANVASAKAGPADDQTEESASTEEETQESEAEPVTTQGA